MEIVNSFLSNNIDYLNALRHAPPIPLPTLAVIAPPPSPNLSLSEPAVGVRNGVKNAKVATMVWIGLSLSIAIIIYRKWKANRVKKNYTNF